MSESFGNSEVFTNIVNFPVNWKTKRVVKKRSRVFSVVDFVGRFRSQVREENTCIRTRRIKEHFLNSEDVAKPPGYSSEEKL